MTQPFASSGNPANSPTLTMGMTNAGMIMGTAAYMAPEQAAGQAVDKRADIWSFGVVLWEMLVWQSMFTASTVAHILAAVLRAPIDLDRLPKETPRAIRQLFSRCLDRDVKTRLRDIGEARVAIQNAGKEPDLAVSAGPIRPRFGKLPWIAAMAVLALALTAVSFAHFREKPPLAPVSMRFQILSPPTARFGVQMGLSPDGRMLAFTANSANEFNSIWVRPLDSLDAKPSPNAQAGQPFFWSPDSRFIAYASNGKLVKTEVGSGSSEVICDAARGTRKGRLFSGRIPEG